MRIDIVDLSHWNTVADFAASKRAGLIGVIHKATEGTSYADTTYWEREKAARAVGLGWGAYHFLKHGNIATQMDWFVRNIRPVDGMRVAIDYEDPACVLDDLLNAVTWMNEKAPGLELCVYGGSLLKEHLGNNKNTLLGKTSLWLAQYTSGTPSWPKATWPYYTLWQYSDGQAGGTPRSIGGIADPHDCNQFNGSKDNCAKWMGMTDSGYYPAPPEPEPQPEPLPETVTLRLDLRITLNEDGTASSEVLSTTRE